MMCALANAQWAIILYTGRLFLSFGGLVCADRISNCPGNRVLTYKNLIYFGVLFSPMVSGWAGGRREKVCPACISETVSCRKLILSRDIG